FDLVYRLFGRKQNTFIELEHLGNGGAVVLRLDAELSGRLSMNIYRSFVHLHKPTGYYHILICANIKGPNLSRSPKHDLQNHLVISLERLMKKPTNECFSSLARSNIWWNISRNREGVLHVFDGPHRAAYGSRAVAGVADILGDD